MMPLRPIVAEQGAQVGRVLIHPGAVIAQGVLLQAEQDAKIVVEEGACLGMGSILHAIGGTIQVGRSASLGAGVLVVGYGNIGEHACVGAQATLFFWSLQPHEVVRPGGLLGCDGHAEEAVGMERVVYGREYVDRLLVTMRGTR